MILARPAAGTLASFLHNKMDWNEDDGVSGILFISFSCRLCCEVTVSPGVDLSGVVFPGVIIARC